MTRSVFQNFRALWHLLCSVSPSSLPLKKTGLRSLSLLRGEETCGWTRVSIGAAPQTRRCARRGEWRGRAGAVATGLSPRKVRLATGSLRWSFFTLGRLLALTSRQYSMIQAPRARRGARAGLGRERDCERRAQTPTKLRGSRAKGDLSSSLRLRKVPTPGRGLREDTGHSPGGPSPRPGGGAGVRRAPPGALVSPLWGPPVPGMTAPLTRDAKLCQASGTLRPPALLAGAPSVADSPPGQGSRPSLCNFLAAGRPLGSSQLLPAQPAGRGRLASAGEGEMSESGRRG